MRYAMAMMLLLCAARSYGQVAVSKDDKGIDVKVGGKLVLRYHTAIVQPPEGQDPKYARSGFIHPLNTAGGKSVTGIHPKDHYHHLGVWNPWTSIEFEGRKLDCWNLKAGTGLVRCAKVENVASGAESGEFTVLQEHVDLSAPGGPKVMLNDLYTVRVWNIGDGKGNLIDIISKQTCASDSPVKLPKYRYGGFGYRATADWNAKTAEYLTSEGKTRKNADATKAKWCLIYGESKDGKSGLLAMSHPQNPLHPEPLRTWDDKQPGVFLNFATTREQDLTLEPKKEYFFRYRLYAYDGELDAKAAEALWQAFAAPPAVKQ